MKHIQKLTLKINKMEKLILVQNELKVPKGNLNKFGNYKYRSAEDILEAVKPLLSKHELVLILTDDMVLVGNKIFLKATAKIADKTTSISVSGYAETSEHKGMSAEQTTGTASSYARKYALNGLFLIDETESDADSQKPQEQVKAPEKPALTDAQAAHILNGCKSLADLAVSFKSLPVEMQKKLESIKNELKVKLTPNP